VSIKNKAKDSLLIKGKVEDYHHLSGKYLNKLEEFEGQFLITGASGWLGKATLELLRNVSENFPNNIVCFGSSEKFIKLLDGTKVKQHRLLDLMSYPKGKAHYLINLAFLTKEKSVQLPKKEFIETNRYLLRFITEQSLRIEVPNIITMSSGSVYSQDNNLVKDIDEDIYGFLKLEEESVFLKLSESGSRIVIPRLFNVSGPHVYKYDLYMLPSLIYQALKGGKIVINSEITVYRSFVSLAELMSVVLGTFEEIELGDSVIFDASGEEVVEIGELALKVKRLLSPQSQIIRGEIRNEVVDTYLGSIQEYTGLIRKLEISPNSLKDQILCTAIYLNKLIEEEI